MCLIFAAGCQGGFFDSLKQTLKQVGGAFTDTFKQIGHQAKDVGLGLLAQLKEQGTQLAGQTLQSKWLYYSHFKNKNTYTLAHCIESTLEKPKEKIKNGQSSDTGNIGNKTRIEGKES